MRALLSRWRVAVVAAIVGLGAVSGTLALPAHAATAKRPNIVFVLTDDLSGNLVTPQLMPNLWKLEHQGAVFENYFVTDSLCCPSRASIFTGLYPHDDGVYQNRGVGGGYPAFQAHHDQLSTLATDLHAAGYRTAMMGKYLNRYHVHDPIPPGWDVWDVADWGYPEFNYALNQNDHIVRYGGPNVPHKDNYLTDVLSGLGTNFIRNTARMPGHQPFFLEVASFAPHAPYTPAPKYAHLYENLRYPRTLAFDAPAINPPPWLAKAKPLSRVALAVIKDSYRLRAEDVKSVDDMIGRLVATLRATHELSNTYFVFSSDNGYHMGEHRLLPGKLTAFDTDIKVPLIIVGPHVPPGLVVKAFGQNIDLRPTFDALAGTHPAETIDGRSLAPWFLRGAPAPTGWPQGVLVEHRGPVISKRDPDYQSPAAANPPSYEALRLKDALYVEYSDGSREYYDLSADPFELDNVYGALPATTKAALHETLVAMENCHSTAACSAPLVTLPPGVTG